MKLRFPLYAKILLWFFLNLVLLGVVFYGFFRIQFHAGLDSLLAGQAGERVERLSRAIGFELRQAPREEWTEILKRFDAAYGIQFSLFRPDGGQLAGETIELPPEVRRRLGSIAPRRRVLPGNEIRPGEIRPGENRPAVPREPRELREEPLPILPDSGPRPPLPKFMVRTADPTRYWVVVRMPLGAPQVQGAPSFLVVRSDSLSGGGLFLDFKPWVAAGFGAVILSVLFWLPLIRGITRSLSQVSGATEQIAAGRFDVRVNATRHDELGRLGASINHLAARLDGYVTGQRRFLGDVAHELCSPLSRMEMALAILERQADEKQRAHLADVREDLERMSSLVNELLSFSKASIEPSRIELQPVSIREIAENAISRESTGGTNVRLDIADGVVALAEPELLSRALANLLRNAVRYAGHAGPVTVSARREGGDVLLTVADCGPGVPEEGLTRIFDPFYRLDASRNAATGGVGLGLAIVKTCVESCRGTVTCRNCQPSGLEVTVRLTAAPPRGAPLGA